MTPKKGGPRDHVLWHANDLFGLHHSMSCSRCGQTIRDTSGDKRVQRLRHLILHLFSELVPETMDPQKASQQCGSFVDELKKLAEHSLGENTGAYIEQQMQRFLRRMERGT